MVTVSMESTVTTEKTYNNCNNGGINSGAKLLQRQNEIEQPDQELGNNNHNNQSGSAGEKSNTVSLQRNDEKVIYR